MTMSRHRGGIGGRHFSLFLLALIATCFATLIRAFTEIPRDDLQKTITEKKKAGIVILFPEDRSKCSQCKWVKLLGWKITNVIGSLVPVYESTWDSPEGNLGYVAFLDGSATKPAEIPSGDYGELIHEVFAFFEDHVTSKLGLSSKTKGSKGDGSPPKDTAKDKGRETKETKGRETKGKETTKDSAKDSAKDSGKDSTKEKSSFKKGAVIKLDSGKFKRELLTDTENVWFVKFYAPWCGHCKAMAGEWVGLAKKLGDKVGERVKIAEVDATVEQALAAEYGVQGYPTLMLFPAGGKSKNRAIPYHGDRKMDSMAEFALKHSRKLMTQITSQRQYDQLCKGDQLCFISFLPHILDSNPKERKNYLKVINQLASNDSGLPITFAWIEAGNSLELERALHLGFGWPASIIINERKKSYATHRGGFSKEELTSFINGVGMGRVIPDPLPDNLPEITTVQKWSPRSGSKSGEL